MKFRLIYSFFLVLIVTGCDRSNQEKNIKQKLKEIKVKEQQLLLWEQRLKNKEDSLLKLGQLQDTSSVDSISGFFFNPALTGNWNVRMLCIQTTCEGSAIGDTKTERWNISYMDSDIVVRASSNNKVIRVYEGSYSGDNTLQLIAQPLSAASTIKVTLRNTKENRMEGIREIVQGNGCKIVYSLELEKL